MPFELDELTFGPVVIDGNNEDDVLNDGRRIWVEVGEEVNVEDD